MTKKKKMKRAIQKSRDYLCRRNLKSLFNNNKKITNTNKFINL
jgi:hypothetical protein